MKLSPALSKKYTSETLSALEAQRRAHEISFGPIVFQVSRLMIKFGILQMLVDSKNGLTLHEVAERTHLPRYAVQVLLESSLTAGTILCSAEEDGDDRFTISKAGWFLLSDPLVSTNMDFNHHVNYAGLYYLEEALLKGKPEGLKVFGNWNTIYEGLSVLPDEVRKSWFTFDHLYSDHSFAEALTIVFARRPRTLLDVGGNTGRWALRCVEYDAEVAVTIMDLPQQIGLMQQQIAGHKGAERICGHGVNLLDEATAFPGPMDAIWMSQFLDCFSEAEITRILRRAAASMAPETALYIMETFWDRQRFETAAFCLTQISLYFTALANGNSKMYHSDDLIRCVEAAGLYVDAIHDGLRGGHSILVCKKTSTP
jgi:hypothetical protein